MIQELEFSEWISTVLWDELVPEWLPERELLDELVSLTW